MKRGAVRISTVIVLVLVAAVTLAYAQRSVNVVLTWAPNPSGDVQRPNLDPMVTGTFTIRVAPFTDKRDKGNQIGVNNDGATPVPFYCDTEIAPFVSDSLRTYLHDSGVPVVDRGGDRTLRGELDELWIKEASGYHGIVRVKFLVADAAGRVLWSGLISGVTQHGGRSMVPENVNETVSNAMLELIANLVKDPGFRQVVRKR